MTILTWYVDINVTYGSMKLVAGNGKTYVLQLFRTLQTLKNSNFTHDFETLVETQKKYIFIKIKMFKLHN